MATIDGKTKLLGVIGYPIEHSRSPVMHNAALRSMGLNYAYLPFPVAPEALPSALAGFEAIGVRGFSVTIPHKLAIVPHLAALTEKARLVGAVNTVWRSENGWQGTNTDVDGFLAPLRERARDWRGTSAVILGNGGAARAVAVALVGMGCGELRVVGRDPEKLAVFKGSWTDTPLHDSIEVHGTERLPDLAPDTGLLVNTTPLGMSPRVEASPAGTEVLDRLPPGAIVYDLIYNPQPTRFLQLANERGLVTIDGLEMLVQQGAIALELWLGRPAPVGVMREALSIADP